MVGTLVAYLNRRAEHDQGWWYYFPVVATYKVPLGIAAVLLLGLISIGWERPRWAEWGLFVPCVAWGALMINSKVNIGFRHFLPAYVFLVMLSSRCVARAGIGLVPRWPGRPSRRRASTRLSFHPDYLSYLNAPRSKPYLTISDSNVDWGQSLKQVRDWLDAHPAPARPISPCIYFRRRPRNRNVAVLLGRSSVPA